MPSLRDHVELYVTFLATYGGIVTVATFAALGANIPLAIGAIVGQLIFLALFLSWALRNQERYK